MNESEKIAHIAQWLGTGSINFFGRPFAGKDSQAELLAQAVGGAVIGGGDILRNNAPDHIIEHISEGHLAPTDEYLRIVLPYVSKEEFRGKPLILSAVGRREGEELEVVSALETAQHPLKAVIHLEIGKTAILQRLAEKDTHTTRGARHDDAEEKIERRLNEYEEKTLPVIEHYKEMGYLITIDGEQARDTVQRAIIDALYARSRS